MSASRQRYLKERFSNIGPLFNNRTYAEFTKPGSILNLAKRKDPALMQALPTEMFHHPVLIIDDSGRNDEKQTVDVLIFTSQKPYGTQAEHKTLEICEEFEETAHRGGQCKLLHLKGPGYLHAKNTVTSYVSFRCKYSVPVEACQRWFSHDAQCNGLCPESIDRVLAMAGNPSSKPVKDQSEGSILDQALAKSVETMTDSFVAAKKTAKDKVSLNGKKLKVMNPFAMLEDEGLESETE